MTFQEAVLEWYADDPKRHHARAIRNFLERADANPRLWKLAEQMVLAKYEQATGVIVAGTPDWKKILAWFRTNGPVIARILLSVLSIIALL